MKTFKIVYGESLIALLDEEDYKSASDNIKRGSGDIIGWNPLTDDINELFEHLRGNFDFREVTDKELEEVNNYL